MMDDQDLRPASIADYIPPGRVRHVARRLGHSLDGAGTRIRVMFDQEDAVLAASCASIPDWTGLRGDPGDHPLRHWTSGWAGGPLPGGAARPDRTGSVRTRIGSRRVVVHEG